MLSLSRAVGREGARLLRELLLYRGSRRPLQRDFAMNNILPQIRHGQSSTVYNNCVALAQVRGVGEVVLHGLCVLLLGAWGCPDGVLCAARAAERMALVCYLGWLSHKPSTRNLTPARSPAL